MSWLRPCSKASSRSPAWLRSRCSHSDATSGLVLCLAGPRLLGPPGAAPQRAPGGAARPLHHSGGRQASSTQGSPACRPRLRAPPGDMVYANTLTRFRPKLIHVYMCVAQRQSLVWLWLLRPQVATQSVPCGAPHQPQRLAWDFGSGPQAPLRRKYRLQAGPRVPLRHPPAVGWGPSFSAATACSHDASQRHAQLSIPRLCSAWGPHTGPPHVLTVSEYRVAARLGPPSCFLSPLAGAPSSLPFLPPLAKPGRSTRCFFFGGPGENQISRAVPQAWPSSPWQLSSKLRPRCPLREDTYH